MELLTALTILFKLAKVKDSRKSLRRMKIVCSGVTGMAL